MAEIRSAPMIHARPEVRPPARPRADGPAAETSVVLERGRRLSRSLIWDLQRRYFLREGVDAWRRGVVPHYVTSNPTIADAYARVLRGWLLDGCGDAPSFDPEQTTYVIELGSGSGRFAFHLLRALLGRERRPTRDRARVKFVMTDFADGLVDDWMARPRLREFVEAGVLDFARFDIDADAELTLACSGEVLAPGGLVNPVAVLANYVFDGLPQDAFRVADGTLYECLATITSSRPEPDPTDPDVISRMGLTFAHRPIDGPYYNDTAWDRVLAWYRDRLDGTTVLFPCAALRAIDRLSRLSGGRLMLLSADLGAARASDLVAQGDPRPGVHGSFSLPVNYHAIGAVARIGGGLVLVPDHTPDHLAVAAVLFGEPEGDLVETRRAYDDAIGAAGPDDFYTLKTGFDALYERMTVDQLLAYLRLSRYDATIFRRCYAALLDLAPRAGESSRRAARAAVQRVWEGYYPLGDDQDLPAALGRVLASMGAYREALEYFQHSLDLIGPTADALFEMALCYHRLRRPASVADYLARSLELDPSHGRALDLRRLIDREPGR